MKQKLDRTFNLNKENIIDFTKKSDRTMCRASEAKSLFSGQKNIIRTAFESDKEKK